MSMYEYDMYKFPTKKTLYTDTKEYQYVLVPVGRAGTWEFYSEELPKIEKALTDLFERIDNEEVLDILQQPVFNLSVSEMFIIAGILQSTEVLFGTNINFIALIMRIIYKTNYIKTINEIEMEELDNESIIVLEGL